MTALDKAGLVGLCDCERGHNGCGMVGRLCDCQPAVTAPTVAEIAGKLTKAQREALLAARQTILGDDWRLMRGLLVTATKLFEKKLVETPTCYAYFTPLGIAVRAYLQEQAR
jgi:hypothetical protein